MKTPRKLYLLVSRTADDCDIQEGDVFVRRDDADDEAACRNTMNDGKGFRGHTDWRVETFVKGD